MPRGACLDMPGTLHHVRAFLSNRTHFLFAPPLRDDLHGIGTVVSRKKWRDLLKNRGQFPDKR
jgi:hypothetical protein